MQNQNNYGYSNNSGSMEQGSQQYFPPQQQQQQYNNNQQQQQNNNQQYAQPMNQQYTQQQQGNQQGKQQGNQQGNQQSNQQMNQGNQNNQYSQVEKPQIPIIECIYFTATWCGPCKKFYPIAENCIKNNLERFRFYTVDVDKDPKGYSEKYSVLSMPTLIFRTLNNGTYNDLNDFKMTGCPAGTPNEIAQKFSSHLENVYSFVKEANA